MIHRPEYVKKLLQKYLEGTASEMELARWAAARLIYTDEEIAGMAAEVLRETKETVTEQEIDQYMAEPDEALMQIPQEIPLAAKKQRLIRTASIVAAILTAIIILTATYMLFQRRNEYIPGVACAEMTHAEDINTSASSCDLFLGKDSSVTIDSNVKKAIGRIDNITVAQTRAGLLEFQQDTEPDKVTVDPGMFITATTGPQQQYLFRLPDGTVIRLNASSSIRLPVAQWMDNAEKEIEMEGEAYVEKADNKQKLTIKTGNASVIINNNATLNIQAAPQFTSAALVEGTCMLNNHAGKSISMRCSGDKGFFIEFNASKNAYRDTLAMLPAQDMTRELMWKKQERIYHHTPTRQFAEEMSRWYGFTIKNLNCIPDNKYISTKICYRATMQEVFTVFRNAGLSVHESKGMISFCDPALRKETGKEKTLAAHSVRSVWMPDDKRSAPASN